MPKNAHAGLAAFGLAALLVFAGLVSAQERAAEAVAEPAPDAASDTLSAPVRAPTSAQAPAASVTSPATEPVPEAGAVDTPPPLGPVAAPALTSVDSALSVCEADRVALVAMAAALRKSQNSRQADCATDVESLRTAAAAAEAALREELQVCEDSEQLSELTNIRLNEENLRLTEQLAAVAGKLQPGAGPATACAPDGEEAPHAPSTGDHKVERDDVETRLSEAEDARRAAESAHAEAEARAGRAEARLAQLGYGLEPEFRFVGDAGASFLLLHEVMAPQTERLAADRCAEALRWIVAQPRKIRPLVWVWDGDAVRVCEFDSGGAAVLRQPGGKAEAHLLSYR